MTPSYDRRNKDAQLAGTNAKLDLLIESVERIETRLNGNGHEGIVSVVNRHEVVMQGLEGLIDDRVELKTGRTLWKLLAAMLGSGAVSGTSIIAILKLLGWG